MVLIRIDFMEKAFPKGFAGINYEVCMYCKHLVGKSNRDGYNYGCGLIKRDGKNATLM